MAKKWETAKVIIAIAKAQHEKAEDKPKPYTAPQLTSGKCVLVRLCTLAYLFLV